MSDQSYYDAVAAEIQRGDLKPGLWVRAVAESNGDGDRARSLYIQFRVEQLRTISRPQLERSQENWRIAGRFAGKAWARLQKKASEMF